MNYLDRWKNKLCCHGDITIDIWNELGNYLIVIQEVDRLTYGRVFMIGSVPRILRNSSRWRHNEHDSVSNHQPQYCLFNRIFRRRSKKTSKLRVTGICAGNSARTGGFPAQMASKAENFPISWHHHDLLYHAIWPLITRSTFMYQVSWINSSPFSRRRPLAW